MWILCYILTTHCTDYPVLAYLMYVNWKLCRHCQTKQYACFTKRIIAISPPFFPSSPSHWLSLPLSFHLLERIQFRKKAARTNSASAGMVKLRNFSSRSDVSNHSGERRAAFTRILFCCLDTYISRLIARARAKKGKIIAINKFRSHSGCSGPIEYLFRYR